MRAGTSLRFLAARVWAFRRQGFMVFAVGLLAAASQVAVYGLVKPSVDILFSGGAKEMIGGLSWISPEVKASLEIWLNTYLLADRQKALHVVIVLILCMAVVNLLLSATHRFISRTLSRDFQIRVFKELYDHLLACPLSEIQRRRQGDIMSRFSSDILVLQDAVLDFFQVLFKEPFFIVFSIAACVLFNWKVTLFSIAVLPLIALAITMLSQRVRRLTVRESEIAGNLLQQVGESISGLLNIKVFQSEAMLVRMLGENCARYLSNVRKIIRIDALTSPAIDFLGYIAVALVLGFFAPLVLRGEISPGDLITILMLLLNIYRPMKAVSNGVHKLSRSLAAADRIVELLNLPVEKSCGKLHFPEYFGSLEIRNLRFAYPGGSEVLSGLDATIAEGERIALVGPTGAGKSTLLHLIPMFFEFPEGGILLSGQPLQRYDLRSLRSRLALVSQNVFLFNDTVHSNIAAGGPAPRIL